MSKRNTTIFLLFLIASGLAAGGLLTTCTYKAVQPPLDGQPVHLTLLQTSDIHSRLLPYTMTVGRVDLGLGLNPANAPFGGAARVATIIKREREKAGRVLHIDCGDPFQGAPIFNFYKGEAEFLSLAEMGTDVMVLGNHEFDAGITSLADKLDRFTNFPVLASNYAFRDSTFPGVEDLGRLIKPYVIFNLQGLKVGVIGVGDFNTINTILESGNRYGIVPLNYIETTQFYINLLRPQVNVIIVASHIGLTSDQELIEKTSGIDVLLGGHLHIVLHPSKGLLDCAYGVDGLGAPCTPRTVVLSHAGAFAKYVARLDLVFSQTDPSDLNNWEVVSNEFMLFPVDSTVAEDPVVADMLDDYVWEMDQVLNKDQVIAYAPSKVIRYATEGGDSPLGNLVSTAMWLRTGIETDLAFTNSTGIRSDLPAGPVTVETLINVFPFDNTITTMFLTGAELFELFDYAAHRTTIRGCKTQVQVAGMTVKMRCGNCPEGQFGCVEMIPDGNGGYLREIFVAGQRVDEFDVYEIATNDYVAQGGSGYTMLRRNTSQVNSGVPQRDALIDYMRGAKPCVDPVPCESDADCPESAICACSGMWIWDEAMGLCAADAACSDEEGKRCVLDACVRDLAAYYAQLQVEGLQGSTEADAIACTWMNWAADECSDLACVGVSGGNLCWANEECAPEPACTAGTTCCKAPGASDVQSGLCTCSDKCDGVFVTGMEDGRIDILTD
jgi:5'-nucleotidase/UDP-sugar diphosphatase